MSWWKWPVIKPRPKYRLVPDTEGTFMLERWHGGTLSCYMAEKAGVTPDEADLAIRLLERDTVYYREG